MLSVHLSDGRTLRYDLRDETHARNWLHDAAKLQPLITGLTVNHHGVTYSMPRPRDLRDEELFLFAEPVLPGDRAKGGERIVCHAGEMKIDLMIHDENRAARINVTRDGRLRFSPVKG